MFNGNVTAIAETTAAATDPPAHVGLDVGPVADGFALMLAVESPTWMLASARDTRSTPRCRAERPCWSNRAAYGR